MRSDVRKMGFERVVIGLSGGIDSALRAAVACAALGSENVLPFLMPYRTSASASESDARVICDGLGMSPTLVDISPRSTPTL